MRERTDTTYVAIIKAAYFLFIPIVFCVITACTSNPKQEEKAEAPIANVNKTESTEKSDLSELFKKLLDDKRENGTVDEEAISFFIDPGFYPETVTCSVMFHEKNEMITGGNDGIIRVLDPDTGKEKRKMRFERSGRPDGGIVRLALSSWKGVLAAAVCHEGVANPVVEIYEYATGKEIGNISLSGKTISRMVFSGDGNRLAAACGDDTVMYWKAEEEYRTGRTIHPGVGMITALAFAENDIIIASGDNREVKCHSLETGTPVHEYSSETPVTDLAVHADYIAAGCANNTIVVFDRELRPVKTIRDGYHSGILSFSPDGDHLLSIRPSGKFFVYYDVTSDFEQSVIAIGKEIDPFGVHFIDNDRLIIIGGGRPEFNVMDIASGSLIRHEAPAVYGISEAIITENALVIKKTSAEEASAFNLNDFTFNPAEKSPVTGRLSPSIDAYAISQCDTPGGNESGLNYEIRHGTSTASLSTDLVNGGFFGFMGDDTILVEQSGGYIAVYDREAKKISTLSGLSGRLKDLSFHSGFIAAMDVNNLIAIWREEDIAGGTPFVPQHLHFFMRSDNSWVLASRNGYYTEKNGGSQVLWLYQKEKNGTKAFCGSVGIFSEIYHRKDVIGLLAGGKSYREAASSIGEKQPLRQVARIFPEESYYLSDIGGSWFPMDSLKETNQLISTAYMHKNFKYSVMIMEEKTGNPFVFPGLENYSDRMLAGYSHTIADCKLLSKKEFTVNGKNGILLILTGNAGKLAIQYYIWFYCSNDRVYQLVSWKMDDGIQSTDIPEDIMGFYGGFNIFSTDAAEHRPDGGAPYVSGYGYTINFPASGFSRWDDIGEYYNIAESGGYRGNDIAFFITPIDTGEIDPSIEALTRGFLEAQGINVTNADLKGYKRIEYNGLRGVEFSYLSDYHYYFRILKTLPARHCAYYIALIEKKTGLADAGLMEKFYDSISFTGGNDGKEEGRAENQKTGSDMDLNSALIMNKMGLFYFSNSQYIKSLSCFRAAFEKNNHDADYFENVLHCLSILEKYNEGLQYLDTYLTHFPDNISVRSYLAFFLKQTGQKDKAAGEYKALFDQEYRQDYDFVDYLNLLWEMERKEEAFDAIKMYQKEKFSVLVARKEADLYEREGQYEKAITMLKDVYETTVFDQDVVLDLCMILNRAGRSQEAIDICEELIRDDHRSADIYFVMGLNQLELNWYQEAKLSFEKAHELNPTDTDIKEYIDYVSGLLGEKDNTSIKKEIKAVMISPEYLEVPDPGVMKDVSDRDAFYLHRVTAFFYKKDLEMKYTMYYRIKVLTYPGISHFSTFTLPFDPLDEGIYVNELKVFDEKGKLVSEGDPSKYFVMDDTSSDMATGGKVLNVPIPGLQPGYSFSISATWSNHNFNDGPRYYFDYLARTYPIINNYVIITGDIDAFAYSTKNMPSPQKKDGELVFRVPRHIEISWEPYQDMEASEVPEIHIGCASNTWKGEVDSYLDEIEEKLVPREDVVRLSDGLVSGCTNDEEKIEKLARYVQANYTYKAIEFGRRGWVPNDGDVIIHNKYGDCKDLSLLLYLMLKAEGILSHLVLTSTSTVVAPDLPDLDQFDHVLLYIPGVGDGQFLDPTNKSYDITRLPPEGLSGQYCLVLDRQNPRIIRMTSYPAHCNAIESERTLEVGDDDSINVRETLYFKLYAASFLRAYLNQFDNSQRQTQIQSYMASILPGVKLKKMETLNLDDTGKDFILHLEYTTGTVVKDHDRRFISRLPAVWERAHIFQQHLAERKTPFRLYLPLSFKSRITIRDKGDLSGKNELKQKKEENDFTRWSIAGKMENGAFVIRFDFYQKQVAYPKEDYHRFEAALNAAVEHLETRINLLR
ncbi:MAG: DUF3857 domain-containing protein [Spirochaetales bacterium]|nr:DUF3857 domain-containing protein [Spirochaetales bacterium]